MSDDAPFEDLLRCVDAFGNSPFEFMIVGGFAVGIHGHERTTKDLDIVLQLPFKERDQVKDLIEGLGPPSRSNRSTPSGTNA